MPGCDEIVFRGEVANEPKKFEKWLARLSAELEGLSLLFRYEAGPCGYGLYRLIFRIGHD